MMTELGETFVRVYGVFKSSVFKLIPVHGLRPWIKH